MMAPRSAPANLLSSVRFSLGLVNRMAEAWYRQLFTWYHLWRGRIVIFDRHFYSDYMAHDLAVGRADRSPRRRVYGFLLKRIYPKPDLVVFLDAPTEVLWNRKQEGTIEVLRRRREEYLSLHRTLGRLAIVDATQPLDTVVSEVGRLILNRRN